MSSSAMIRYSRSKSSRHVQASHKPVEEEPVHVVLTMAEAGVSRAPVEAVTMPRHHVSIKLGPSLSLGVTTAATQTMSNFGVLS